MLNAVNYPALDRESVSTYIQYYVTLGPLNQLPLPRLAKQNWRQDLSFGQRQK